MSHHMCQWDKLKQVPQQAAPFFILVTRRGVHELLDSVCYCWRGYTVSPTSFSAAFLSFAYLHLLQSFPCSFEQKYLAFLLMIRLLDSNFGHSWGWFTNFLMAKHHFHHSWLRGGQTSIPHAYRQILFLSCCSHCWDYDLSESSTHYSHNSNSRAQTGTFLRQHLCPVNTLTPAGMGLHQLEDFQWAH